MTTDSKIAKLRRHLKRGLKKIARIAGYNARRRKAIKRLEAESGATAMFDSVDLDQVPDNAPAVGAYVGGAWPTYWDAVKRFPHAVVLAIAVAASEEATCLDIESGDATIEEAPAWWKRQRARGVRTPWFYISVSEAPRLEAVLADAGIKPGRYHLFTAHWTFEAHICGPHSCGALERTASATQWTDKALGRNLDQSLVAGGVLS